MVDIRIEDYSKLIERYARVALLKIMRPPGHDLEDLIQEGALAFLLAKQGFTENSSAVFRTYLTTCLRNRFYDIVKKTYQNKKVNIRNDFQDTDFSNELSSLSKRNGIFDTLEIVQVSFLIKSFNENELEYVSTLLSLSHNPRRSRRKNTREILRISYERETELRKSIHDKIRK